MGMYTGLRFKGTVKKEFRDSFEDIAMNGNWKFTITVYDKAGNYVETSKNMILDTVIPVSEFELSDDRTMTMNFNDSYISTNKSLGSKYLYYMSLKSNVDVNALSPSDFIVPVGNDLTNASDIPMNIAKQKHYLYVVTNESPRDRAGNLADEFTMSLPTLEEFNAENGTTEFVYKELEDYIVVYNPKEIPAAVNGYFEIAYSTSEQTLYYKDYDSSNTGLVKDGGTASDPFYAILSLDTGDKILSSMTDDTNVFIGYKVQRYNRQTMTDDLKTQKGYMQKNYASLYSERNNMNVMLQKAVTKGYTNIRCDKVVLTKAYNFCSVGFYEIRQSIENDINIINESANTILQGLQMVQSTQESNMFYDSIIIEALTSGTPENKATKMSFVDSDGAKVEPGAKGTQNQNSFINQISNYIKISTNLVSAKMKVLTRMYKTNLDIVRHYVDITQYGDPVPNVQVQKVVTQTAQQQPATN